MLLGMPSLPRAEGSSGSLAPITLAPPKHGGGGIVKCQSCACACMSPEGSLACGGMQTYLLSIDSGQGYNLDLSLFERLVKQRSFPVHSLAEQHRMRPAISALIRDTIYPQLRVGVRLARSCCALSPDSSHGCLLASPPAAACASIGGLPGTCHGGTALKPRHLPDRRWIQLSFSTSGLSAQLRTHAFLPPPMRILRHATSIIVARGFCHSLAAPPQDHPRVQEYPPVKGMLHSLYFLSHDCPEGGAAEESDSKYNTHEALLVVRLARYLLQQGYPQSQVTILTPYLGQLRLIRCVCARACACVCWFAIVQLWLLVLGSAGIGNPSAGFEDHPKCTAFLFTSLWHAKCSLLLPVMSGRLAFRGAASGMAVRGLARSAWSQLCASSCVTNPQSVAASCVLAQPNTRGRKSHTTEYRDWMVSTLGAIS
jgi:hypothetical protein